MKNWLIDHLVWLTLIVLLVGLVAGLIYRNKELKNNWSKAELNNKAYAVELGRSDSLAIAYSLSMEQLRYMNDSLSRELVKKVDERKIKDKRVKSLSYVESEARVRDTLFFNDTIFADSIIFDTVFQDAEWYAVQIRGEYPNALSCDVMVKSSLSVLGYYKREPIKTPKKTWLGRLFQKKHKVLYMEAVEDNPYIDLTKKRFIEVL